MQGGGLRQSSPRIRRSGFLPCFFFSSVCGFVCKAWGKESGRRLRPCIPPPSAIKTPPPSSSRGKPFSLGFCFLWIPLPSGGINVTLLPLFSALFQTFFLALGEKCGTRLSLSPAPKESLWSLLSGGILILLAVIQLLGKK